MWCVRETRRQSCVRPVGRRGRRGGSPGPAARGCSLRWARRERFSSGLVMVRFGGCGALSEVFRISPPGTQKKSSTPNSTKRRPRYVPMFAGSPLSLIFSLSLSLSLSSSPIHENPGLPPVTLPDFLTSASPLDDFSGGGGGTSETVWVGEEEGGQKAMNDNGGSNGAEEAALTVWGRRRKKTRYKRGLGHSLLLLCRRKLHDVLPRVRRRGGLLRELVLVLWDET